MRLLIALVLAFLGLSNGIPLAPKSGKESALYYDDMRFPAGYDTKSGIIDPRYRWPGGVVIYELDSLFTQEERVVIQAGLDDITAKTCIRFQTRTFESDYVFVVRGDSVSGCWSYVGRLGGRQELNLQVSTSGGHCIWNHVVSHEFIHAIGYYHEQSRTDRDDFVNINWDNIYPEYHYAFDKYGPETVSPFDTPYDYYSIMHYESTAFAIDFSIPTITPKEEGVILGNDEVSPLDAQKINNMYQGICP